MTSADARPRRRRMWIAIAAMALLAASLVVAVSITGGAPPERFTVQLDRKAYRGEILPVALREQLDRGYSSWVDPETGQTVLIDRRDRFLDRVLLALGLDRLLGDAEFTYESDGTFKDGPDGRTTVVVLSRRR